MRILITGTAGFIGFHLARRLLGMGWEVIGLDNVNDYYSCSLKEARLGHLIEHAGFTEIRGDLAHRETVASAFDAHRPDIVCNLAAQAGVRYSLTNPAAYVHSNLDGFTIIIEEALKHDIERFVYASSSSVYGGNTKMPFAEDDRVDTPISLYAATKRANELIAHTYSHLHGMRTAGLRFFTVYGPWGRPDMAYFSFTQRVMRDEMIRVFNHGRMKRDFTYIDDIIDGVVAALTTHQLDRYEVINLGNNRPVELMHLINLIEDGVGAQARTELLPMQPGDVEATYADIEKARAKLGFAPSTSIEDGMERFLAWVRDNEKLFLSCSYVHA